MINRAWLNVSPDLVAQLLGLPNGSHIVRADFHNWEFSLRFGVEGPAFPGGKVDEDAPTVSLLTRYEIDGNIRRVFGYLSHDPQHEWLISEQLIKAPEPEEGSAAA